MRLEQNLSPTAMPFLDEIRDNGKRFKISMSGMREVGRHNVMQKGKLGDFLIACN